MSFFRRSSSKRRSSEASSSSSSVRRSYVEPSENSIRDAATKSCLCHATIIWCVWASNKNLSNMFTMLSSDHTLQISATNTSDSQNHLPKNLNSVLVNPEYHLNYMTIHLLYLWRHFLITAKFHLGVHWTNHQGRSLRYS